MKRKKKCSYNYLLNGKNIYNYLLNRKNICDIVFNETVEIFIITETEKIFVSYFSMKRKKKF